MTDSPEKPDAISGRLAIFATQQTYDVLPDDVRKKARQVLLDTIGCALAGSVAPEVANIRKAVTTASGSGESPLWGSNERAPLPQAALANGAASHAREIDDFGGCAHSGAVVIPAALGTAMHLKACGKELLTSIVVGYDIARRVMDGGGGYVAMKKRGWHTTSTCGVFGAAAAVGRLLKLSPRRMQWAIGYAGSNAGGTWSFIAEGAMSKRVNPGWGAQTGVVSAYLAANDVTSPATIFETDWGGFYPTYSGPKADPKQALKGLGSDYQILIAGFKPYAACRGCHSSIDVALGLHAEGLKPDRVKRVLIEGSSIHSMQLGKKRPTTLLDSQFSIPYSLATAFIDGKAMLDEFTPTAITRKHVLDFANKVDVVVDPRVADGDEPFVTFELTNGERITRRVEIAKGDWENPLSEEELSAKFRSTAGQALSPAQVAHLEETLSGIDRLQDVSQIAALLTPARSAR
jgi:2-methylcitrate dehydratase PrpD